MVRVGIWTLTRVTVDHVARSADSSTRQVVPWSPRATDALTKSTIDPREERLMSRSFHIFPAAFGFWRSRCGLCWRSGSRGAVVPGVGLKSRSAPLRFAGGWVVSSPDRGAEGRVMPERQYVGLTPGRGRGGSLWRGVGGGQAARWRRQATRPSRPQATAVETAAGSGTVARI